jgi:hypothetical protein
MLGSISESFDWGIGARDENGEDGEREYDEGEYGTMRMEGFTISI